MIYVARHYAQPINTYIVQNIAVIWVGCEGVKQWCILLKFHYDTTTEVPQFPEFSAPSFPNGFERHCGDCTILPFFASYVDICVSRTGLHL